MSIQRHPMISLHRQSGFSIVSAIFLLVVIAGLGAAMLNISTSQHTSSALDLEGTRAYHAARSGIEWGVYKIINPPAACFGPSTFVPQAPTLASFSVAVTCTSVTTSGITVYTITSTASSGTPGSPYYVRRKMEVIL